MKRNTRRSKVHGDGAYGANRGAPLALPISGREWRGEGGRRSGRTGERRWRAGARGKLGRVRDRPAGDAPAGPGFLGRSDERNVAERARQPPPGGWEKRQGAKGRSYLIHSGSGGECVKTKSLCVCVGVCV